VWLGAHIGTSEGLAEAVRTGRSIGSDAIQIFSKSPQSWRGPPIRPENAAAFRAAVRAERIRRTAIHHCYLTNLGSPKAAILRASRAAFLDEIDRADLLGVDQLIFHPGAHTGTGPDAALRQIAEALDWALGERPNSPVRILLENAAGQGTTVGRTFEELAQVIDRVGGRDRLGVAIDTCHLFAAGVDFRTPESYGAMKDHLRATLGLRRVQAFHLNDSRAELGAHIDRHANIGEGAIGAAGFAPWLNDPTWSRTPGYLETPLTEDDYAAYAEDLRRLRALQVDRR
jgi:deoxyribonuclease IV